MEKSARLTSPSEIQLPPEHKSVLLSFYEAVKSTIGDDLSFFMVCGSAGRGHFINGWSDIDVLIVCDSYNSRRMSFISDYLETANIKIGTTIYSSQEIHCLTTDAKTFYSLYLLQQGKLSPFLYRDSLLIPTISKNALLTKLNSFTPEAVHKLKRLLYRPAQQEVPNIVKTLYLIIKNHMLSHDAMPASYQEAFEVFSKKYGLISPAVPPEPVLLDEITAYAHSVLDILTMPQKQTPSYETETTILSIVREITDREIAHDLTTIDAGTDLFLYGIDSLNIVQLILAVEHKFGIQFNDEEISPSFWQNVSKISALVNRKSS